MKVLTVVAMLVVLAFAINYSVGLYQEEAEFTQAPQFKDATIVVGELANVEFFPAQSITVADQAVVEVSGRKFRVQGLPEFKVGEELKVAYRNADSKVFVTLNEVMSAHKSNDLRTVVWLCGQEGCSPIFRR